MSRELCGCGGIGRRAGLRNQYQRCGGSSPFIRTNDVSVRTFYRIERYRNQSENKIWLIFLLLKNNIKIIQMKGWCKKMKIIKQELEFEECLKQRLEFICEFSKVTPTFTNGSIRKYLEIDRKMLIVILE